MENKTLSKLQSEAVKQILDWYQKYRVGFTPTSVEELKTILSDQIQKAYSKGREEVMKEFDKQWADLGVGGKHPPWHVWIENCQLRCLQGTHLDRKKLSIQSKEK